MPSLVVGISSDILYPIYQQRHIHAMLDAGGDSRWFELDSPHGHDAFLINLDQLGPQIEQMLTDVAKG